MKIEVGKPYPFTSATGIEVCRFDLLDVGAIALLQFRKPTAKEINDCKKGKFSIALAEVDGILFFLLKLGSMPWMDMPFHPALSKMTVLPQKPEGDAGYGLNIILVDSVTNIVKSLRLVTIPHEVSIALYNKIMEFDDDFDSEAYDKTLYNIYSKMSTDAILKTAFVRC